jgi:hypothetical protein
MKQLGLLECNNIEEHDKVMHFFWEHNIEATFTTAKTEYLMSCKSEFQTDEFSTSEYVPVSESSRSGESLFDANTRPPSVALYVLDATAQGVPESFFEFISALERGQIQKLVILVNKMWVNSTALPYVLAQARTAWKQDFRHHPG